MQLCVDGKTGPPVASPPLVVEAIAEQLRRQQADWPRQFAERPERFADLEVNVQQAFQRLADQLVAGLLAQASQLGGLAPLHHPIAFSPVVLGTRATASRKKTPALTVPQLRQIMTRLLKRKPTAAAIAEEINEVARRNEEARIYHWHEVTGKLPPRRRRADT